MQGDDSSVRVGVSCASCGQLGISYEPDLETNVDERGMRELLRGYLSEMDWSGGATKAAVNAHLVERDRALATMVNEYVAEGSYRDADHLLTVIPEEAWQSVQGDNWQGSETQFVEDVPSHFQDGPAGRPGSGN